MSNLSTIANELNGYITNHGQIKRSTFIKSWHELDNNFWLEFFGDAMLLEETSGVKLNHYLLKDMERLANHAIEYKFTHPNILNPTPRDMRELHHKHTHFDGHISVKGVLWSSIMRLREYYCAVHDIDLPNEDSSINKLKSQRDLFGELFIWR